MLPIIKNNNLYFTNAIFTVWLPDDIPYVEKSEILFSELKIKKKKSSILYKKVGTCTCEATVT